MKLKLFSKKTAPASMPAETPAKPRRRLSRRKKTLIVFAVLLLAAGIGYYKLQKNLTGPSVGTVVTSIPTNAKQQEVELEQFDGKLFSFAHPVTYVEQAQKNQPSQLEGHTFISSQMMTSVLVTAVSSLPSNNLEDDASYIMRLHNPDKYKMKSVVVKNEKVTIFTTEDNGQLQQVAFWLHAGKLMTFALSGVTPDKQATTTEFDRMVQSISWR